MKCPRSRTPRVRPLAVFACAALAAALGSLSRPAAALQISDLSPLYFEGPGGWGFAAADVQALGLAGVYVATPNDAWLEAGNVSLRLPIQIEQHLGTVHRDPQAAGRRPSTADPFVADSRWRVTNRSGSALKAPLLVFTTIDPLDVYPAVTAGLDAGLLEILEYSSQGVDYRFGAVRLPDLGDGESAEIDVRYVVASRLKRNGQLMPPLGVALLGTYASVPEPARGVLAAVAVAGLVAARRRSQAWPSA